MKPKQFSLLKQLLPYLWRKDSFEFRMRFIFASLCIILARFANAYVPVTFKGIVDHLSSTNIILIIPIFLILAHGLARIMAILFAEGREFIFAKVVQSSIRKIALKVFNYVHKLGLSFHLNRKTGQMTRVIERGTRGIETFINFTSFQIIPVIIDILLVIIIFSFLFPWPFLVITVTTIISYIFYTIFITEWRIQFTKKMNASDNDSHTKAIDSLLNFETVKYFCNEQHEEQRFDSALKRYEVDAIKNKTSLSILNFGQGLIISIGLITLMIFASQKVIAKELSLGDLVMINTYLIQLYIPLNILGFAYREIKQSLINIKDMFDLFDNPIEINDKTNASSLKIKSAEIQFENVSFSYSNQRAILKNISLHIKKGHTLAIVGESGSGKSTITRLLFRFYDPSKGNIIIDGQNIADITQISLRQSVGIVPQDIVLFNDTIAYNIGYGNPKASFNEIKKAAQKAHIHDFIQSLPEAYETTVGERGLKLSGGEKQRIAIARTILKKPDIFVFDEATSSLDSKTEKEIQKNIFEICKDKTTIIVAHRLSTITHADEIIVLEKGTIKERGTHQTLLKEKGLYHTMWEKQRKQDT